VARDPGGERVGVRARPERVLPRVGIVAHRLVDAVDELVDAGPRFSAYSSGAEPNHGASGCRVRTTSAESDQRSRQPITS